MFARKSVLLAAFALCVAAPAARAQGPARPAPSPEVQARMKAWQKFRDTHKNVFALQQTLFGLEQLERDPKLRLNKSQAKTVVTVLKSWRNKPVMTDAQALKVNKQITEPLSLAQLKKLAAARERPERRPGAPGASQGARPGAAPRTGAPSGARPGGTNAPRMDASRFPAPREYNPLNPATIPMERQRESTKQRLDTLTKRLSERAAGK